MTLAPHASAGEASNPTKRRVALWRHNLLIPGISLSRRECFTEFTLTVGLSLTGRSARNDMNGETL